MTRTFSAAILILISGATSVAAQQSAPHAPLPSGWMWRSTPYTAAMADRPPEPAARVTPARKPERIATTASAPARTKPSSRRPVPAAAVPAQPPRQAAAAKTRDLARRIEALAPGTKLDQPMNDPDNPSWRRRHAERAGIEGRDFSMPIDQKGEAGFVARGYHQDPSWYN
ncbi:MAG: hypothetical protein ACREIP_08445, partial [Alphaproteobacteria bacterium]